MCCCSEEKHFSLRKLRSSTDAVIQRKTLCVVCVLSSLSLSFPNLITKQISASHMSAIFSHVHS